MHMLNTLFLFHQGKKICILLKHQTERAEALPIRPISHYQMHPAVAVASKSGHKTPQLTPMRKRCSRGTLHILQLEICLFTLQGSVSDSSLVHFQIDFDTFSPSNHRHCLPFCGLPRCTNLCTLLEISTSSSSAK